MKVKLKVENGPEIARKLKKLGDEGLEIVKRAAIEGAEEIREEIENSAPVRTGDLRDAGFIVKPGSKKQGGANAVITISSRFFEYAFYLEFGRKGQKTRDARGRFVSGKKGQRQFIRPAFDLRKQAAIDIFERELKKGLDL
jgi:HK97 gp10 family phage protein